MNIADNRDSYNTDLIYLSCHSPETGESNSKRPTVFSLATALPPSKMHIYMNFIRYENASGVFTLFLFLGACILLCALQEA